MLVELKTLLITDVIAFVLGLVVGLWLRGVMLKRNITINPKWISGVITAVWAISVIAELINPTYQTSPLIHGLMGVVAAYFFKNGSNTDAGEKK